MGKRVLLSVLMLAALAAPAIASGFPDTYGFGIRAMAMGNAFTAVADDFSAVYYNPAGLSQKSGHEVELNVMYGAPQFEVTTLSGQKLVTVDTNGYIRTDPTEAMSGHDLKLAVPLIGAVLDVSRVVPVLPMNVRFGVGVSMPQGFDSSYQMHDYPPDQPHFIRYGDNIDRMVLNLGIGIECVEDLLHLGLGTYVMLGGPGMFFVDDQQDILQAYQNEVVAQAEFVPTWSFEPVAGILVTPFDGKLKLGLSYAAAGEVDMGPVHILSRMVIGGSLHVGIPMTLDINCFYTPAQTRMGLAVDLDNFLISLDVAHQQWSKYDYSETDKHHYNIANAYDPINNPRGYVGIETGSPDFDDTVNISLGGEYRINQDASLLMGFSHVPTPVPSQSGRISNYLDADKKVYSLGASYTFHPKIMHPPVKITGVLQYQDVDEIKVYKNNVSGLTYWDGINRSKSQESYKIDGDVLAAGISFNLAW